MIFKRSKPVALFFRKTIGLNNFFNSNWKQFQIFKIAKFESRQQYTIAYGQNVYIQVCPLKWFRECPGNKQWECIKATVWVFNTNRVCHVWCNFNPGYNLKCRTTVILCTLKDGSLQNSLALNSCFSYRNVFQNGVNALSKMVFKKMCFFFFFFFFGQKAQNLF